LQDADGGTGGGAGGSGGSSPVAAAGKLAAAEADEVAVAVPGIADSDAYEAASVVVKKGVKRVKMPMVKGQAGADAVDAPEGTASKSGASSADHGALTSTDPPAAAEAGAVDEASLAAEGVGTVSEPASTLGKLTKKLKMGAGLRTKARTVQPVAADAGVEGNGAAVGAGCGDDGIGATCGGADTAVGAPTVKARKVVALSSKLKAPKAAAAAASKSVAPASSGVEHSEVMTLEDSGAECGAAVPPSATLPKLKKKAFKVASGTGAAVDAVAAAGGAGGMKKEGAGAGHAKSTGAKAAHKTHNSPALALDGAELVKLAKAKSAYLFFADAMRAKVKADNEGEWVARSRCHDAAAAAEHSR
jgi:hypothetical protein